MNTKRKTRKLAIQGLEKRRLFCVNYIQGDGGNDRIIGSSGPDRIFARGGNDEVLARGGADCVYGEQGNDRIFGEGGSDELRGNEGRDEIFGGNGNDFLGGGPGNDRLEGGEGNDTINGGSGEDVIHGGRGADVIEGGDDSDCLRSGFGVAGSSDRLSGGNGDDQLVAGSQGSLGCDVNNTEPTPGFRGDVVAIGGAGADTFEPSFFMQSQLRLFELQDFTQGEDKINLRTYPSITCLQEVHVLVVPGMPNAFQLPDNTIVVLPSNVQVASLTSSDFTAQYSDCPMPEIDVALESG
ncbi:MAG: calcium-binding protein, partial [Planctomycetota bacterium]